MQIEELRGMYEKSELNIVYNNSNSLSGLMFGYARIYLKYKSLITQEEFLEILNEFSLCGDKERRDSLKIIIPYFENNNRLEEFINKHIDSIDDYKIAVKEKDDFPDFDFKIE